MSTEHLDEREVRISKMQKLREAGINPYPRADFKPNMVSTELYRQFKDTPLEEMEKVSGVYKLCGRVILIRDFGKGGFITVRDNEGKFQCYISKKDISEPEFDLYKQLDIGDFIGFEGQCLKTRTGDLAILAKKLVLMTKSIRPLPEKFHGLTDVEARYRQRYLDLIVSPESRDVFKTRSKIINAFREILINKGFLEVETPMMHSIAGGATARPFITHHNTLDMELFMRVAPELYLKRLVVGGLERVFEINRNFRNEGISTFHNPEFTMMELYQAYATYEDLIELVEETLSTIAEKILGTLEFDYQDMKINFNRPWKRVSMKQAVLEHCSQLSEGIVSDKHLLCQYVNNKGFCKPIKENETSIGELLTLIFEEEVESKLINPTFITHYPVEVSPLARRFDKDPSTTERFEVFIAGREFGNAFTELNDPIDQKGRFEAQVERAKKGDLEAQKSVDEDYITALEHGMPPTGGLGIGIDRFVMLLTNSASIRDVILFPQLRKKD